jgi:hypothetical protein
MKHTKILMAIAMLGALILLLLAGGVFAQTVPTGPMTISLTAPTKRTDGSNITGALTYKYEWGSCPISTPLGSYTTAATSHTVQLPAGTYCARASAIEAGGGTSQPALAPNNKSIIIAPPNPPIVTLSSAGYSLILGQNGWMHLVRNGSVTRGAECDLIPSEIEWMGLAEGKIAICGPS